MVKLVVCLLCSVVALSSVHAPAQAGDLNSVALRGHVAYVNMYYTNGVYTHSQFGVWADSPHRLSNFILVNCEGNSGGSLAICKDPSAMLPCSPTVDTATDPYWPGRSRKQYVCSSPARRDAGACVDVSAYVNVHDVAHYSTQSLNKNYPIDFQPAVPEAEQISVVVGGWVPLSQSCTAKP